MGKVLYNRISKRLKRELGIGTPLRQYEVIKFEYEVPKVYNEAARQYLPKYPQGAMIPSVDNIFDPYWDADGNEVEWTGDHEVDKKAWERCVGKMVPICCFQNAKEEYDIYGNPKTELLEFTKANDCSIVIYGTQVNKRHIVDYLRLSPLNKASKSDRKKLFKETNGKREAASTLQVKRDIHRAEEIIFGSNNLVDLQQWCKAMNLPEYMTIEESANALINFVNDHQNALKFLRQSPDAINEIKDVVQTAAKFGIIKYDKIGHEWLTVSGKVMFKPKSHEEEVSSLIKYFTDDLEGINYYKWLVGQVDIQLVKDSAVAEPSDKDTAVEATNKGRPKKIPNLV